MMRLIYNNLAALWATLALLTGISCWFAVVEPTVPAGSAPVAETWTLPKIPESQSRKSLDIVSSRNLWGVVVAANAPKEPAWTIQGIARTSTTERFVLMSVEGKPAEILKVGDLLPDGTKIVQIDSDRFLVETPDKKKIAFGIYKNETKK